MEISQMKNLKLNYHLLEECNFKCKFCFASRGGNHRLSFEEMKLVIRKTAESGAFNSINFAGGEPFLFEKLPELIEYAKSLGLYTSVITNGSLLGESTLKSVLPNLDCIGFSLHSLSDSTNREIGFCQKTGSPAEIFKIPEICEYIRENSNCKIKLNTVVNSKNKNDNLSNFVKSLNVDRWKILRCQKFGSNIEMLVTDEEWTTFCRLNSGVPNTIVEDKMKDTYIIVNPSGFLIKESRDGKNYEEIGSVLTTDIKSLLKSYPLHLDEYKERYQDSAMAKEADY